MGEGGLFEIVYLRGIRAICLSRRRRLTILRDVVLKAICSFVAGAPAEVFWGLDF